jgi:ParB-like chromosome segregation protein Spo0J
MMRAKEGRMVKLSRPRRVPVAKLPLVHVSVPASFRRSIEQHGVIEPLLVADLGDRLVVLDGRRRLLAAWLAEVERVPVRFVKVA